MGKSKIEWTEKTWNPTRGCQRVSPGCQNCYAERMSGRFCRAPRGYAHGYVRITPKGARWTGVGHLIEDKLLEPLSWREPALVFVDSMSDLFFEEFTDREIAAVCAVMAVSPQHTYQVLTKRSGRMREWFKRGRRLVSEAVVALRRQFDLRPRDRMPGAIVLEDIEDLVDTVSGEAFDDALEAREDLYRSGDAELIPAVEWPLPNVWVRVSVENQDAVSRVEDLARVPTALRFLSVEPLLGPVDISRYLWPLTQSWPAPFRSAAEARAAGAPVARKRPALI